MIRELVDSVARTAPADKPIDRAEMERQLAAMNVTMEMTVDLDARTGLVLRAVSEKHVAVAAGSGTDRLTIEAQ